MNDHRPIHVNFLDDDMKRPWETIDPDDLVDRGFALSGDTALAMYLNHRSTREFTFVTHTTQVNPSVFEDVAWFGRGHRLLGQHGAVNVRYPGERRNIMLYFRHTDFCCRPRLEFPPHVAANGVPVARPTDVLVDVLATLKETGSLYLVEDIVAAARHLPNELNYAINRLKPIPGAFFDTIPLTDPTRSL